MGEFDLIQHFFVRPPRPGGAVALGAGDDCALLQPAAGMQLAISCDLLVEGRHFLSTVDPERLGHKSLAVNLSDLAACGARPVAFTLALALPRVDQAWLAGFSRGMFALADEHDCELVGGDTTRGPLAICITVFGEVPAGQALLRSGARADDDVWVSGHLGDARLALEIFRGRIDAPADVFALARERMERPTPRVALGQALRGTATSAIDVSDGLAGDLGHVLARSKVGATLNLINAPVLLATNDLWTSGKGVFNDKNRLECVFSGGDDYELAFTAPAARREAVEAAGHASGTRVTRIGRMEAEPGLRFADADGRLVDPCFDSFDHFK